MFGSTDNYENHVIQWNRSVIIRHIIALLIWIFISFIFCYQVANIAIVQTGPTPSFFVTFFRAVQDVLHLPFFWMDRNQIYRHRDPSYPGLLAGARALRLSFLIFCSIFWGCFIYILFPSLRKIMVKLFEGRWKRRS